MSKCVLPRERNLKAWTDLVAVHGETAATGIWSKFNGRPPSQYYTTDSVEKTITETQRFTEEENRSIVDSITSEFLSNIKEETADELLGVGTERGSIPVMMLRNAYVEEDGTPVTQEQALELYDLEQRLLTEELDDQAYDTLLDEFEEKTATLKRDSNGDLVGANGDAGVRDTYFDVYQYWNGGISTANKTAERIAQDQAAGNTDIRGWRNQLQKRLEEAGYTLQQTELGFEVADDQEIMEKIYGRSVVEEDPSRKLTGRIRQTLSTIPAAEKNFLGYNGFIPADQVFADLSKEFAGAPNYESMKLRMRNLSKLKPEYKPVYDFMQNMNKQQAAGFKTAFSLSARDFVIMKLEVLEDKLTSKMFNPNQNSVEKNTLTGWTKNSVEGREAKPNAVYKRVGNELEVKDPNAINTIKRNVKAAIEASAQNAEVTTTEGVSAPVQAYADALWTMGIDMSTNGSVVNHAQNLQALVNKGHTVPMNGQAVLLQGNEMFDYLVNGTNAAQSLKNLSSAFVSTDIRQRKVVFGKNAPVIRNIHTSSKRKAVQHIAQFSPLFKRNRGDVFVNLAGNRVYPLNLPHNLSRIVESLQQPGFTDTGAGKARADALRMYEQSKFMNPEASGKHRSILLRGLRSPEFAKEFGIATLDGLKLYGETQNYENFAEVQSLTARLEAWYNNANANTMLIAIPTMSDRTQLTFMTQPRYSTLQNGVSKFGIAASQGARKDIIKSIIIQDLVRIAEAKDALADTSPAGAAKRAKLANYYETGPDGKPKARSSAFLQFDAKDAEGLNIVSDRPLRNNPMSGINADLSTYIRDHLSDNLTAQPSDRRLNPEVNAEIEAAIEEMAGGMVQYFDDSAQRLLVTMDNLGIPFAEQEFFQNNKQIKGLTDLQSFAEAFVFDDAIGRIEATKLLVGPMAQFNGLTDFYKRQALLTTPGLEVATTEDLKNAPNPTGIENYGMPPTFKEMVIEDFKLDLTPQQRQRANETADSLRDGLIASGIAPDAATRITDKYRPGTLDATDAQSFITLDHYRDIQQGLGQWTLEDEMAWKQYAATGRFEYQEGFTPAGKNPGDAVAINPLKPFYGNTSNVDGVINTDVTKNSYHVLLANETQGNPMKDALRIRMESPQDPISVANFVTTKKARKSNAISLQTELTDPEGQIVELATKLAAAPTNTLDSKKLRFPQIIPPKKSNVATYNRQQRKNLLANVKDNAIYYIGTENPIQVTGRELKERYHEAINEKISRDIKGIADDIGITRLDQSQTTQDKLESLRRVHQNLRKLIQDENLERELPDNNNKGLNIVEDAAGRASFEVPLDFPVLYEQIERQILGLAVNRAFKQKLSGEEAVQVADIGGFATDEELKFYTMGTDPDGRPRLQHMEVALRADIAEKYGIRAGEELTPDKAKLIGYRIPQQGKSSTVLMRIAKILPNNHTKAIIVPAQITALTGSDFDIDKMMLIFPEVRENGEVIRPRYELMKTGVVSTQNLTSQELNNVIYDTIETVQSSANHFNESVAPLDETTLSELSEEMAEISQVDTSVEFNDWASEIQVGIRNTLGVALRGLWANAQAGQSVSQHGTVAIDPNHQIVINTEQGQIRGALVRTEADSLSSPIDANQPINQIITRYLSAAVDAGKKPVQFALNDNVATFPVETLWLTTTGDSRSLHLFLNQPIIRAATDLVLGKYGGNPTKYRQAFVDLGARIDTRGSAVPMNMAQLESMELNPTVAANNFLKFREAGQELNDFHKAVTPDAMDGLNTADSLKSYSSTRNKFNADSRAKGKPLITDQQGNDPTNQFLDEGANFSMNSGFESIYGFASEQLGARLLNKVFSPAMQTIESQYLRAVGKDKATSAELKELRRAAMLNVMTNEGSPMAEFFSRTHLQDKYLNPENNLVTQHTDITAKNPEMKNNKFVEKFTSNPENEAENIMLLDFDTSQKMTKYEKDSIIADALKIYENPELYASNPDNPQDIREIQDHVENLFMNAFIVNGFRISNNSYIDLIPVEYFTSPRFSRYGQTIEKDERFDKSIVDYYKSQNLQDPNYFDNFMVDYMRQHGTRYVGGKSMLKRSKVLRLNPILPGKATDPVFKVFTTKTGDAATYVKGTSTNNYYKLNQLGGRIMESSGINQESVVNPIQQDSEGRQDSFLSVPEQTPNNVTFEAQSTLSALNTTKPTGRDRTDIICG